LTIAIILNGISRKKKFFYQTILPVLASKHAVEVRETKYAGHARELAAQAAQNKTEVILSAGGDGTLHQVLNGVFDAGTETQTTLGVIPLGSGNDFAGAVGATTNGKDILEIIARGGKPTDVGLILCKDFAAQDMTRYFINVCSMGMGPATIKQMEKAPLWVGVNGRYLTSILKTFFTHKPEQLELKTSTWNWQGKARVLAIANGKSFGNKIYLAPDAKQDDGLFNLFVAADLPLLKFLRYLQTIKKSRKVTDAGIYYAETNQIEISAPERVAIEAEGEAVGFLPATISIKPLAVSFLRQ